VNAHFDEAGWALVERFRQRLVSAGFPALAEAAELALGELHRHAHDGR
jgi:hypothetical protein